MTEHTDVRMSRLAAVGGTEVPFMNVPVSNTVELPTGATGVAGVVEHDIEHDIVGSDFAGRELAGSGRASA
ncbi:hypothetical protein GXW82_41960 [Streptacidiphilus sp. 4-A2]|nr:hypothetical protein [Streptacidiphilus sp. 4-A2]